LAALLATRGSQGIYQLKQRDQRRCRPRDLDSDVRSSTPEHLSLHFFRSLTHGALDTALSLSLSRALRNPGVITVWGYTIREHNGIQRWLLIMDYASNGTLYQALLRTGPDALSWNDRVTIAKTVTSALEYLHANGVVHCDLKCANILVRQQPGTRRVGRD